ncbi:MAG: hypothetical protein WEA80_09795 [Gemmatimonadaceae bacterium]
MNRARTVASAAALILTGAAFTEIHDQPPGSFLGGVSGLSSRERAYFTADLRPWTYTLVCFVPDHKDGKPHIAHGMFRDITVE